MNNKSSHIHRPVQKHGMGGRRRMAPAEKAKDFKGTLKKLFTYLAGSPLTILFVVICAVGGTVFSIIGPKVLGMATTELANGLLGKINQTGGIDFSAVGRILLIVFVLYAISSLLGFVQGFLMTGVTQTICYELRRDISEKINSLPLKYFEDQTYGEVISRITNDVDTLGSGMTQSFTQIITSVTTLLGVLIMMLSISPLMTMIALLILPLSVLLVSAIVKRSQKYFRTYQDYLGHINGQVEETYGGHPVVKAFNREKDMIRKFEDTNDVLYESAWKSQFISGLMHPIMVFVGNLGYVGVAVSGAMLAINGRITIGDIQAFIQYVKNFTQPIQQIAQITNMLQSMTAAAERIFEFLSEEDEKQISVPAGKPNAAGVIEFKNVRFGYNKDEEIIKGFSCRVEPGQKIAIVGPTGAGKTTQVKLLMRYYDVDQGAITIDGVDIRSFSRSDLRSVMSMVLQETWLFKGTIMENIRYGRLEATDEEVIKAAKAAHAHHFIQTLPEGYQTELNEEASNVSQGQKQLITIARAILADKPILILDEATSSVDTRTEIRIQQAMDELMKGCTSFIIAHRLSTIRNADMIVVIDKEGIVEQGTHDQLMTHNGRYAELYNSQFMRTVS